MLRRSLLLPCLLVLLAILPGIAAPGPQATPPAGRERFLQRQKEAVKAATRAKDWPAAMAAWNAVLELDPASLEAFAGLAEVAALAADRDAEAFARVELAEAYRRAGAESDTRLAREARENRELLTTLVPAVARAEELVATYARRQAELAGRYEEAGMPATAIAAWARRLALLSPGSAEAVAAATEIARILRDSPDCVVRRFDPGVVLPERDEAWIAEQDRRSAKFSSALRFETPHYRIRTNAGWRLGNTAAAALERVHAFYREIWGIVPDPPPERVPPHLRQLAITPIDVNIYATRAEYLKRSGAPEWSGGVFTGSEVATYDHGEGRGKGTSATLTTLFHEASHQFMHVAVGSVPSFVNEGIASLFEGIEILPNGSIRRDLPVPNYLVPLAAGIRDRSGPTLTEIFEAQENLPEQYASRWGVMYFLRMYVDEQGNYPFRDRLTDYIFEFKKGGIGNLIEHFTEFMLKPVASPGLTSFEEFEQVWRKWIVDLDDERNTSDKRLEEYRRKGRLAALLDDHATSLLFHERMADLAGADPDALFGIAVAGAGLGDRDRAVAHWQRFLLAADPDDTRRAVALEGLFRNDPEHDMATAALRDLVGGMAGLGLDFDADGLPRMAMWAARSVLRADPLEASARALLTRVERETGLSVVRWRRLFNGFDLDGWYGVEGGRNFHVSGGVLTSDSRRTPGADGDAIIYQALLLERPITGDWSLEVDLQTSADWRLAGVVFGARDGEHFEAISLRRSDTDEFQRVDFGTYSDGQWSFGRLDGAVKASFDPVKGARLRVDVRGAVVSVSIDGQPLPLIKGRKVVPSVRYPLAALRGDIGVLASRGTTRFLDIRLLAD